MSSFIILNLISNFHIDTYIEWRIICLIIPAGTKLLTLTQLSSIELTHTHSYSLVLTHTHSCKFLLLKSYMGVLDVSRSIRAILGTFRIRIFNFRNLWIFSPAKLKNTWLTRCKEVKCKLKYFHQSGQFWDKFGSV